LKGNLRHGVIVKAIVTSFADDPPDPPEHEAPPPSDGGGRRIAMNAALALRRDDDEEAAADALFDELYSELHRLARRELNRRGSFVDLGVTTLLHEAVLRLNGDLAGAETLLRQCLEINRKTRGEDHPNTAVTLHDLALIAASRGDYSSAESQLRQVLETQRRTLGDNHPIVSTTLNSLSS
jgi:tetratricopeptide (TPR) repeat protein